MNKKFSILIILSVILAILISGLYFTGFILNNNQVKPPAEGDIWQKFDKNNNTFNDTNFFNNSLNYSIFSDISNMISDINGIDKIEYEIYLTNQTLIDIIEYYNLILIQDGFSYNEDYSGITPSEYFELDFYTYTKGLNAVVIFLKSVDSVSWVCYSTGNLLDYQSILENNFFN